MTGSPEKLPRALTVLDEPFYRHNGRLYCAMNWWRFAERLAEHFAVLTLYVPLSEQAPPQGADEVLLRNCRLVGRFFYRRAEQYYRRFYFERGRLLGQARDLLREHDVLIVRVPAPVAMPLARLAWRERRPTVLFVGGDILTATGYRLTPGVKGMLARWMTRRLRADERRIARRSALVAAWGQELLPVYQAINPRTVVAASPSISRELLHHRQDTATGPTIRLIRVARILPNKGLEFLLKAVADLRRTGLDVRLDVAGGTDDPRYLESLLALARNLALGDTVRFHGQVAFGPDLFALYRGADLHVVSSLSEGLPRCIVEARLFGVPTIATAVGGVPTIVRHEIDGLLIRPGSQEEIAQAVVRLVRDGRLRQTILRNGYAVAERETVEFQALRLAGLLSLALQGRAPGPAGMDLHLAPGTDT